MAQCWRSRPRFLFRHSFNNIKNTHPPPSPPPTLSEHTCQPFSQCRWPGTQRRDSREKRVWELWKRCTVDPYLQQHHVHSPVHLGDVTQTVAPLVPLVHVVQMRKRGNKKQDKCRLLSWGTSARLHVQSSKFPTVSWSSAVPSRLL